MIKKLVFALKECIDYIEDDIDANIIGLQTEADLREWLDGLKTIVAEAEAP